MWLMEAHLDTSDTSVYINKKKFKELPWKGSILRIEAGFTLVTVQEMCPQGDCFRQKETS